MSYDRCLSSGPGGSKPKGGIVHSGHIIVFDVLIVKIWRHISGTFAAFGFFMESVDDLMFDIVAALGVDGVCDVRVQFQPRRAVAVLMAQVALVVQSGTATVAEAGAEVVFFAAALAMVGQFARGHGQKKTVVAFDQLDVADDEGVVKGQRAERLESTADIQTQIDANFGEFHG